MTFTPGLSIRPALMLGLALLVASFLFLTSHQSTSAGNGNSLAISPELREIGVGATGTVGLTSMAPAASLGAWVVDVVYDPAVVSVQSCQSIANPAGSVGIAFCQDDDQEGGPDNETVVSVGAFIFPDTQRGLDGTNTLATITFQAVGAVDDCSDLTINVVSHLGPDPEGPETDPATTNGQICIVEQAGTDRLWGDSDCGGAVNPVDSLKTLRFDAGLSVAQAAGCPLIGANVMVDGNARLWNDIDCNGAVNPVDSLKTLRFDAGLSVAQTEPCPGVGTNVNVVS